MIYSFIALISTTLGTLVGIGGGMIIRPVLAFLDVNKGVASFSLAITVCCMAAVNLLIHKRNKVLVKLRQYAVLAAGSIIGGFVGSSLLSLASTLFVNIGFFIALGVCDKPLSGCGNRPVHRNDVRFFRHWRRTVSGRSPHDVFQLQAQRRCCAEHSDHVADDGQQFGWLHHQRQCRFFAGNLHHIGSYHRRNHRRPFKQAFCHKHIALIFNCTVGAIMILQLCTILFR